MGARRPAATCTRCSTRARARPIPLPAFRRAYRQSAATATLIRVEAGEPGGEDDGIGAGARVRADAGLRADPGAAAAPHARRAAWSGTPASRSPGLGEGERLTRRSVPPERAQLLARDGEVLAEGPADARSSPLGGLAASIAGVMGPSERRVERAGLYARGFPRDWPVGQNGLERAFERQPRRHPRRRAPRRIAACWPARSRARPRRVRTTIDTDVQEAAVAALAGRLGGIAAIDARTGEIRALAGLAFSAPQPPGSTFKIVTATAALETRAVRPGTEFPVATAALIDGVELENANGEYCGGTFKDSFAHSCNSVFAPLGVKIGADQIVNAAVRYGWNTPPVVPGRGAQHPPAGRRDHLTARGRLDRDRPGQGAGHAAAARVGRPDDLLRRRPDRAPARGRPAAGEGAGHHAAGGADARPPDAGRRGLRHRHGRGRARASRWPARPAPRSSRTPAGRTPRRTSPDDGSNTDAWFTAYAPARRPRIAVAVLLVRAGAGGETAAPAARLVLGQVLGSERLGGCALRCRGRR